MTEKNHLAIVVVPKDFWYGIINGDIYKFFATQYGHNLHGKFHRYALKNKIDLTKYTLPRFIGPEESMYRGYGDNQISDDEIIVGIEIYLKDSNNG